MSGSAPRSTCGVPPEPPPADGRDPATTLSFLWWRLTHLRKDRLRRAIVEWADRHADLAHDADLRRAVDTLRSSPPRMIPYPFTDRYRADAVTVHRDRSLGLHYVEHRGHRLYWREGRKARRIAGDYQALLAEQDPQSPHRYFTAAFDPNPGCSFADVGSAEGIVALDVVERADHLHLFEGDADWRRALEATFRPWREKVTIVDRLVGRRSGPGMVALDDVFADRRPPDFLKVDVEGCEADVIHGAARSIARADHMRAAVCAYHGRDDEAVLRALLESAGFAVSVSTGYMLLAAAGGGLPEFRRGVLRAERSAAALRRAA